MPAMQLLLYLCRTISGKLAAMRRIICAISALWLVTSVLSVEGLFGQADQVRINEFMALNGSTLADEDGEYPDWIEIYNAGTEAVPLLGWSLSDDPDLPRRWVFPDVTLGSGGYLVVFASGKNRTTAGSQLHTSFNWAATGSTWHCSTASRR
jgi:hypothetical protein